MVIVLVTSAGRRKQISLLWLHEIKAKQKKTTFHFRFLLLLSSFPFFCSLVIVCTAGYSSYVDRHSYGMNVIRR